MTSLKQIADKILCAKKIAAYGHIKTDCDCVASLLAFREMCLSLNKHVDLFVDSLFGESFLHLPNIDIINNSKLNYYDLVISLDTATPDRLGKFRNEFVLHKNSIRIDHHESKPYAKLDYVDSTLPANCLILKKLQNLLGVNDNDQINYLLLSGTLADTGCFKYNSTNSETFYLAAKIIEKISFNYTDAVVPLFQNVSKKKRLLQCRAVSNTQFYFNDKIALMPLYLTDLNEFGANLSDSAGMSHLVLDISTIKIVIAVTEAEANTFYITFYSKGEYDISSCARYFGGGGHKGAAGCKVHTNKNILFPQLVDLAKSVIMEQDK